MCQSYSHFSWFLHHFALGKIAASSIRVIKVGVDLLSCVGLAGPLLPLLPPEVLELRTPLDLGVLGRLSPVRNQEKA